MSQFNTKIVLQMTDEEGATVRELRVHVQAASLEEARATAAALGRRLEGPVEDQPGAVCRLIEVRDDAPIDRGIESDTAITDRTDLACLPPAASDIDIDAANTSDTATHPRTACRAASDGVHKIDIKTVRRGDGRTEVEDAKFLVSMECRHCGVSGDAVVRVGDVAWDGD
jgi:hypothetical protein